MDDPGHELVPIDQQIADVSARLETLAAEAEELAQAGEASASTALVPVAGRGPDQIKRTLVELRGLAARKAEEMQAAQKELRSLLEARMDEARNAMAPLQDMMEKLVSGIEAVNLYLGTSEKIVMLRDGTPAPATTPVCVRQRVLHMDEECAAAAEEGGIDAVSIEHFDEWLLADPAHLDQVLPEAKGVVALTPRGSRKRYEDPYYGASMDEANAMTYLLIRSGDRLFRIYTNFKVGSLLVPAADEFTKYFEEKVWIRDDEQGGGHYETRPIQPGTHAWERAESQADNRRKHQMKVALLLQGLVDRTPCLHPLPAGTVSFIDEASYDAGLVRIITDAEAALGDGHEPFKTWIARLNAQLRPGMRIIGAFDSEEFRSHHDRDYGNSRVHPPYASKPRSGEIYTIEERRPGGSLVFRYHRTDKIWAETDSWSGRTEYRLPKTRASCVIEPTDTFILAFDLVTVEEMERYLRSRTERESYVTMFPVLKAAIAAKRAEAAEEEPFRLLVASQIAQRNGVELNEAMEDVTELVDWWKLANRHHRPLVGTDHPRTLDAIVAEHRRRLVSRRRSTSSDLVERLRVEHSDAVLIARKHSGVYVVLVPHGDGPFVTEIEYRASGKKISESAWKLVGARPNRWETLWEAETWGNWDRGASLSVHLSDPEIEALASSLETGSYLDAEYGPLLGVTYDPRKRTFSTWQASSGARFDEKHLLTSPRKNVRIAQREWSWSRTTGQRPVLKGRWRNEVRWDDSGRPWPKAHRVLACRDDALASAAGEHARFQEAEARARKMYEQVRAAESRLAEAWQARATEAEHRRFITEYLDESLWEGHLKTLGRALVYPHYNHEGIDKALRILVETGLDPAGQKVADAVAVAREIEPQAEDREAGWSSERGFYREITAPADVLDLTF